MSLQTIALLLGLGAVAVAAGATFFRVSPWRVFGLASCAGALVLILAVWKSGQRCGAGTSRPSSARSSTASASVERESVEPRRHAAASVQPRACWRR
jgi:hypothetical protein